MERKKFSLMPLMGGVTPRRSDTPRTQFRKDICQKRLSYFDSVSQVDVKNKSVNQKVWPVTSSASRVSSDRHSGRKPQEIVGSLRNTRSTVYQSTSDDGQPSQQPSTWESNPNRHTKSDTLGSHWKESRSNMGFSFPLDNPDDRFANHLTERQFREDLPNGVTQSDGCHPTERYRPTEQIDSDEVDLGLSTHRPNYSPRCPPTGLALRDSGNRRYLGESVDSSVAPSYDRFDPADLESVLGAERYERLLSNFNESHETLSLWTDTQKSTDRAPDGDGEIAMRCRRPGVGKGRNVNGVRINSDADRGRVSDNDDDDSTFFGRRQFGRTVEQLDDHGSDDDLGLKTHRADELGSRDSHLGGDIYGISQAHTNMQAKDGVRCSFLASEIYAEADKLNNNSASSKPVFSDSQRKPVHKVDYRQSVGMSLNVFERPTRCFGKVEPTHKPLLLEADRTKETWEEGGSHEVTNSSSSLHEMEKGTEGKWDNSCTTERKYPTDTGSSMERAQPECKKALPVKLVREVQQSTGQRKLPPAISDCRLDQLQLVDACPGTSSLERYFSSLESLNKGSNKTHLTGGFEPIPEPQIKDTPRGKTVKKKHSDTGSEVRSTPHQRKSVDSVRSSRSSLQRKGKKDSKSGTADKGRDQKSVEKPTRQVSLDSEDWDISDANSKSFVWSEHNVEAVSQFDPVRHQRNWTSDESKARVSAVTGTMSYVDINTSRETDDRFTDVSSLVISEASSLQHWVVGGHETRSDSKEDIRQSTESTQDKEESEETANHLQRHATDSKSVQHHNHLAEEPGNDVRKGRSADGSMSEMKFDGIGYNRRDAWQEPITRTDVLVRLCPECSTQNGEFETWCRQCRCILAHVAPSAIQGGGAGTLGESPLSTETNPRGTLPSCSWYMEGSDDNTGDLTGAMASNDLAGMTDALNCHHGNSKHQDNVHSKGLAGGGASSSGKDNEEFEPLEDGSGDVNNVIFREQDGLSIANSSNGHIMAEGRKPDLPLHLRISLDSSMDSRSGLRLDMSGQQGVAWRNAARLSEAGQFEYRESVSADVDQSEEMKQELSLNLRASQDTGVEARSGSAQVPVGRGYVALNEAGARAAWPVDPVADDRCPDVQQGNVDGDDKVEDADYPRRDPPAYSDHNFGEARNDIDSREKQPVGHGCDLGQDCQQDDAAGAEDVDDVAVLDSNYHSFVNWLIADPQFHTPPTNGVAIPQPKKSKGRPKTAGHVRPEKNKPSSSQQSLSKSSYKKKWASSRPSVSASFSYDDFARCSGSSGSSKKRPSSAKGLSTSGLSVFQSRDEGKGSNSLRHSQIASARTSGRKSKNGVSKSRSVLKSNPSPTLQPVSETDGNAKAGAGDMLTVQSAPVVKGGPSKPLFAGVDPYALYIAMSPRIESGDVSLWLCLPDEILLHILSFLPLPDLAKCARTCKQFRRVAADGSLWRHICLKKRHDLYDDWLVEIGKKKPLSLILEHCHGDHVTANGMRELFRDCADSLQELSFAGCSRGHLTGDNVLLHAASRCRNITHLDASWCNINDNGVMAMCDTAHQLRSLCLNGCQALSDETVHKLVVKHGIYLQRLELFGCFNITVRSMASMANNCKGLVTLNLGQCWKVTDNSISQLSASLGMVEHLDIRGCKQIRDLCIHHIMKNCPRLVKFSVANCPNITDGTLAEIATYATQIRSLDVCGCHNITDVGVKAIATCCQQLELLDLSSTRATHRSVSVLATSCTSHLQVLKVSFCKNVTTACLIRLVRNCKRLTKLFLYGINGLRNLDELRTTNPRLSIEM